MNLLRLYPRRARESYEKDMAKAGVKNPEKYYLFSLIATLILSIAVSSIAPLLKLNFIAAFFIAFISLQLFVYFRISLKAGSTIKKMEEMFPDAIQLMSSNLRAGMTIDRAFLLSARPEFYPLDEEMLKAGKEVATGKSMGSALIEMDKRIGSEKIEKTIRLIISGLQSGGNISTLLEQTSSNMREKEFIERRAASNIVMYVIFIFFAIGIGAPILLGLSSVLVEIMIKVMSGLPSAQYSQMNLPLTFSAISISPQFLIYFTLAFLVAINIISSLVIGLVNKGEEKAGLRYLIPLLALSISIFFIVRIVLLSFLSDLFSVK